MELKEVGVASVTGNKGLGSCKQNKKDTAKRQGVKCSCTESNFKYDLYQYHINGPTVTMWRCEIQPNLLGAASYYWSSPLP